ncbi:hypothetical protein Hypma_000035 [Hypsizygus marmoreus]|uniref:Uncharacterized protein n=1 Tax=Hypsizygus marmoreus TaxID=39966 RepID=A0A369KJD9_HYPMA|nr:hypothetical protein Hypma_000035 [Hypsizygus marmoreus]
MNIPILSSYMSKLSRLSSCTLYLPRPNPRLSIVHLGIRRWQRRCNSSDSSETIKYATIVKPQGPRPLRVISTLDPSRLQDSDFVDLRPDVRNPGSHVPSVFSVFPIAPQTSLPISRRRSRLYYNVSGVGCRFPENSRGFLYYHRDPNLPLTSGAVRFRVTPNAHALSFSAGTDLMYSDGRTPWAIWLVTIASTSRYNGLKETLLSDGLVMPELMEHCRKLVVGIGGSSMNTMYRRILFTLEQPFVLDLATSPYFSVIGPLRIERARIGFTMVRTIQRSKKVFFPYSGQCMVRFERSLAPEHAGKLVAVIRVLEILTPIEITDPTHTPRYKTGLFRMPSVGSLLVKGDHPITVNADGDSGIARCLRLLM